MIAHEAAAVVAAEQLRAGIAILVKEVARLREAAEQPDIVNADAGVRERQLKLEYHAEILTDSAQIEAVHLPSANTRYLRLLLFMRQTAGFRV